MQRQLQMPNHQYRPRGSSRNIHRYPLCGYLRLSPPSCLTDLLSPPSVMFLLRMILARSRHTKIGIEGIRESCNLEAPEGENPPGEPAPARSFFTNAIMGLRSASDSKALDLSNCGGEPAFALFCREFLVYQIEALRPRLVVVLGPVARTSVESLGTIQKTTRLPAATFGCHATAIHFTSHPYGDLGFTDSRRADEALALKNARDRSAHSGL
jgi:hypothetical protein